MFTLYKTTEKGRRGLLSTAHGDIHTPFFMPIATKGAVKTLLPHDMRTLHAQIILSNTYHLMLQPGMDVMAAAGGLHAFMQWDGPILTDSGGYQVFSLARLRKITDDGVAFRSHLDGSKHVLTPERSMEIQKIIGSDIMMVLDDVQAPDVDKKRVAEAVTRTTEWAQRCLAVDRGTDRRLFGIVQGGVHEDLRMQSAEALTVLPFDGFAIGGLAVGETEEDMMAMTSVVTQCLPEDKPRYFMGGAKPYQIVELVKRGVDMFDCVIPTREARHGRLYVWKHDDLSKKDFYATINITNAEHILSQDPIDASCGCTACSSFSKSYMRHLFATNEMLGLRLATEHNIHFYLTLLRKIRDNIERG